MATDGSGSPLGASLEQSLDAHLQRVRDKIVQRSADLAAQAREPVGVSHLARALEQFAPGREVPDGIMNEPREGPFARFPPLAILSSLLAIAFAGLGLWATLGSAEVKQGLGGQGFLDIAKIFAGAIVGSATATVTSTLTRGKS